MRAEARIRAHTKQAQHRHREAFLRLYFWISPFLKSVKVSFPQIHQEFPCKGAEQAMPTSPPVPLALLV